MPWSRSSEVVLGPTTAEEVEAEDAGEDDDDEAAGFAGGLNRGDDSE